MKLFLTFLRHPNYRKIEKIRWNLFFKLLLLFYAICVPLGLIVGILLKLLNYSDTELNFNTLKILIVGILLGPIIEELLFRLLLLPKLKNVIIFIVFSISMAIIYLIKGSIHFLIIFLLFGSIAFLFCQNKRYLRKAQLFIINHFCFIFYTSCILFGFYHIFNYTPFNLKLFILMPLIVLPQIVAGVFFGFIRMKFGIFYSIIFHSVTNVIPILILLFNR